MPSSKLLKSAASGAVIKEAIARFGKNPKFPQDPEAQKTLFEQLDNLVPREAQTQGIGKQMFLFLLKQLFALNPPGFVLVEDDYKIKPLMLNFFNAVKKGVLQGDQQNLDRYRSLEDLDDAVGIKNDDAPDEYLDRYTPEQKKVIEEGSHVVLTLGPWVVWKIDQTSGTSGVNAGALLCDNSLHGVSWCVGNPRRYGGNYIPEGDFFVLEKNGRSSYAISSTSHSITIWNPADTPIFSVDRGASGTGGSKSLPSLTEGAKKAGVQFNLGVLSAIPEDAIPVLKALRPTEKQIQIIPEEQLQEEVDKTNLYKILHFVNLIKDLNTLYQDRQAYITAHAVMAAAIGDQVHMEIPLEGFKEMNLHCLTGYLEAVAATGNRKLDPNLDAILKPLCEEWLTK